MKKQITPPHLNSYKSAIYNILSLAIIICIPQIIIYLSNHIGLFSFHVYAGIIYFKICAALLLAEVFVFPTVFLKNIWRKAYFLLIYTFTVSISVADIFCLVTYHIEVNPLYIGIIGGTNTQESLEFLQTYVRPIFIYHLLITGAVVGLMIWALSIIKKKLYFSKSLAIGVTSVCLVSVFGFWKMKRDIAEVFSPIPIKLMCTNTKRVTYKLARTKPELVETASAKSDLIVVIIGESHSRSKSSLYGYGKMTNPQMEKLKGDSLLFVFDNVTTGAAETVGAFQHFMSTYPDEPQKEWFETPMFTDVASSAGYHTFWISNQQKAGLYDNIIVKFANTADEISWTSQSIPNDGISSDSNYDEAILPILSNTIENSERKHHKRLIVVHLMGSHLNYSHRYPKQFERFKEDDYSEFPKGQRDVRATYDNSILYNDFLLSQIFKLIENRKALAIYFSDHGQDIFDSDPDFFGHARANDPTSLAAALEVPFLVYMTPSIKAEQPLLAERLRKHAHRQFCTSDFVYTLMDLMGVKFRNDDRVQQKSLLSENP